jgi:hypothetical protein
MKSINYVQGTRRPATGSCADKDEATLLQSFPFRLRVAGNFLESHLKKVSEFKDKNAE